MPKSPATLPRILHVAAIHAALAPVYRALNAEPAERMLRAGTRADAQRAIAEIAVAQVMPYGDALLTILGPVAREQDAAFRILRAA